MKFLNKLDRQYLKICGYVLTTVAAIIAMVLIALRIEPIWTAICAGAAWVSGIVKPVIIGLILAYVLYPVCRFYEKRLPGKFRNHPTAVACTLLTLSATLFIIAVILLLAATKHLSSVSGEGLIAMVNMLYNELVQFEADLRAWLVSMDVAEKTVFDWETSLFTALAGLMDKVTAGAGNMIGRITDLASTMAFAQMFAIYFMLDAENLKGYWGNVVRTIWSDKVNHVIGVVTKDADTAFAGYFRGQAIDALFMAVVIIVSFSLAGIKYGVLIGVLTGLGNLIPYLGPIFGYGLTILSGLITGDIRGLIIGVIIVAIIQGVDGAIVNPKLLSSSIQIHPMLVLVALIAGGKIGGLVGMLVAVPCAAILKIWFERYLARTETKKAVKEESAETTE